MILRYDRGMNTHPETPRPKQFRKKPVVIEAMRLTGRNTRAVICWMEANRYPLLVGNALEPETLRYPDQLPSDTSTPDKGIWINPANGNLMIRTLEGDMRARVWDWIIRGVQGEFYACDPDIFAATYEEDDQ